MNDPQEKKTKSSGRKVPGCDLGTTNSAIAFFIEKGNIEVIANESGNRTTPSLIYFPPEGKAPIVGENAKQFMLSQPERVVYEIKRLIGRKFDDPKVQEFIKKCSYKIVRGTNGDALVKIDNKEYQPVQLSAFILQEMKNIAQNRLSEQTISEIVITVPAHFNDEQRQATKDAGAIAGLKVERIINEPTAAALAYGLDKSEKNEKIAVFDLGGGTFDISIIELDNGLFTVKSTNGDTWLGGSDFDGKIVQWLINKTKEKFDIDVSENKVALRRFKDEAINAKHRLSKEESYEFNLAYIASDKNNNPVHLQVKILRKEFEDMIDDLLKRLIKPCKDCLKDAQINKVDKVILVGGMTRVPAVQRVAEQIFKITPNKSVNPDEAVAIGAAVQGSIFTGASQDILLLDVNPLSLGIETRGNVNEIMIPRNTTIPTKKIQNFTTATDNQREVTIKVIEGEGEMSDSPGNKVLNTFNLTNVRAAPMGVPRIEVEFSIDANGILSVRAKDKDTGSEQKIVINERTRDKSEMERMIKEAEETAEEQKKRKEQTHVINNAESVSYAIKKDLDEFSKKNLSNEVQYQELEKIYNDLERAVNNKDYEESKRLIGSETTDTIIRLTNELRKKIKEEDNNDGDKNSNNDNINEKNNDENDGEKEEVVVEEENKE